MRSAVCLLFIVTFFASCSVSKHIARQANSILINDSVITHGHVGISIYEPSTDKYWFNYQADKYFVPASNTKLFALYAGMKYLGDSITAFRFSETNNEIIIEPTGDPTFLHPDFKTQNAFTFLKQKNKPVTVLNNKWRSNAFGMGWPWDDYTSDYTVERNALPIYGNLIKWIQIKDKPSENMQEGKLVFSEPDVTWQVNFSADTSRNTFSVDRNRNENIFEITFGKERRREIDVPFVTKGIVTAVELLKDTLNIPVTISTNNSTSTFKTVYSQPSDSLYKIMMHRSDNFFAEQTLLMASNQKLGYMNERRMIDTLLKTDLKDIPQRPRWVDGSGLSRYNLFSPADFIYLLQKLNNEFGFERLKEILPTGGEGTLSSLYKNDSGYIFAKTGTLSNHVALSGFLITKKNKLLIFSILPGNFMGSATPVRKAIEKFLLYLRESY